MNTNYNKSIEGRDDIIQDISVISAGSGYFTGTIQASSGYFNGDVIATNKVQGASGYFTGNIQAASGYFTGNISLRNATQLLLPDGSSSTPSLSFSNSKDTGIYFSPTGVSISLLSGTSGMDILTTGITSNLDISTTKRIQGASGYFTGVIQAASGYFQNVLNGDGSVSLPSYSFTSDTNTGIYRIGTDNIGIATNGVKQMDISTTNITLGLPLSFYASVPYAECYYATDSSGISSGYNLLTGWTTSLNSITHSSGAFTVPSAGLYWISYTITTTSSGLTTQQMQSLFTINSASPVTNARAYQSWANSFMESTGGIYCNLAANDVIRFYMYSQGGGQAIRGDATGNRTRCQIIRIG